MLQAGGLQDRLIFSEFAEEETALHYRVARIWQDLAINNGVPHAPAARDVWELIEPALLKAWLERIPKGTLLLIVGGTPCQQLTVAGTDRGILGLTGVKSVHVFAFSVIARTVQGLRPDLLVHVMIENAATTLGPHRAAMLQALGLSEDAVRISDAANWTEMERKRLFISSLPRCRLPITLHGGPHHGTRAGTVAPLRAQGSRCP